MSGATVDDLHGWIDKMMMSLSLNDYTLDVGGNTLKGDGYLGEVTFLKVQAKKNGTKEDYDLVIKSAKKSEELREKTPVKEAYDRESLFYWKIFPTLDDFQREARVEKPFDNIPKCYCVCDENHKEAVILQNLKTLGFDLHDRKAPMNLNHLLLVFQNYGRYHALSLALRHKKPLVFENITRNLTDIMGQFVTQMDMLSTFYTEFENLKKLLKESDESEALRKFQGFEKEFKEILVGMSNEETVPSVILHGDSWNNNFMFKYDGNDRTTPTDMRFLDFQIVRVGSPVIDLSYFFYTCADKQVLNQLDFLLQAYHASLADFLTDLGCDADKLFPFEKLKEHWREYGKFGLVMSLFIVKVSLCNSDETFDLLECVEKGEDTTFSFKINMQNEDAYNDRIKSNFLHFAKMFM